MNIEGKTDKQLQEMCIERWEGFRKMTITDIQSKASNCMGGCAFCDVYKKPALPDPQWSFAKRVHAFIYCTGCPVQAKTGKKDCAETPYVVAARLYRGIHKPPLLGGVEILLIGFHSAVDDGIDFLKALECDE